MSSLKLLHSGGNGVIISAPSSNPASNRTITVPGNADGEMLQRPTRRQVILFKLYNLQS